MTLDPERVRQLRDSGNDGVIVTLYLDISDDEYVAFGEPGDRVFAANPELSKILLRIVLDAHATGSIEELTDDAASAVMWLAQSGTDRQALLAPMMEALHDSKSRSAFDDPMAGYMERAAAAEEAQRKRREDADN